jgi:hypothetical protein
VTGVLPMARCLRAAGVRHLAVENAVEAALVDSLEVIDVSGLEGRHCHAPWRTTLSHERQALGAGDEARTRDRYIGNMPGG